MMPREMQQQKCTLHQFKNRNQVKTNGFKFVVEGPGTSTMFSKEGNYNFLSLQVDPGKVGSELAAARITEKANSWLPTTRQLITADYEFRFREAEFPTALTEGLFLWNAPFSGQAVKPVTSFGVVRSPLLNGYFAIATLDSKIINGQLEGFFYKTRFPKWVNPTKWHEVSLSLKVNSVSIQVTQLTHTETILSTRLPYSLTEKLKFEFSLDNEIVSGERISNIVTGDRLDIASCFIQSHYHEIV